MKELLKQIKKYDKITIFRHINPDGDCVFSALAFKSFIKDNFKDKKVKIVGKEVYDVVDDRDKVSDSFIKGSLAIVVDVSNVERLDDQRYINADFVIKIDHHPPLTNFGDLNYVNDKAAATCEYLVDIFTSKPFSKYILSKKTREYLYCGILTDSLNFKTTSTSSNTLKAASLIAKDDLKLSDLSNYVFETSINEFNKATDLRTYLKTNNKLGYLILDEIDLENLKMTSNEAKNNIGEFSYIKEIKIWLIAAYSKKTRLYDLSLRSKRGYPINKIAIKYGGGGHKNACGIKNLSKTQIKALLNDLLEKC